MRSPARAKRFKPIAVAEAPSYSEHINAVGMIASLVGLLMQVKPATPLRDHTTNGMFVVVDEVGGVDRCVLLSSVPG